MLRKNRKIYNLMSEGRNITKCLSYDEVWWYELKATNLKLSTNVFKQIFTHTIKLIWSNDIYYQINILITYMYIISQKTYTNCTFVSVQCYKTKLPVWEVETKNSYRKYP